jgi:hypothetical protein
LRGTDDVAATTFAGDTFLARTILRVFFKDVLDSGAVIASRDERLKPRGPLNSGNCISPQRSFA